MVFQLEWLAEHTVSSILLKRPRGKKGVVVLWSDMNVADALNSLVEEEILSAPVWDRERAAFIANLDMRDIVNLVAKSFKQHEDFEPKKLIQAMSQDEQFTKRPLKEVFDFSGEYPFFAVTESTSLLEVFEKMVSTGDKHHRRALIFADNSEPTLENLRSMISQSSIITFIGSHKAKLGLDVNHTLADVLRIDWEENKSKVISIQSTSSMLEAFALMGAKNVSGLAVVEEHGQLMGTLGSRDVKGLVTNHRLDLSRLRLNVREYINYIKMLSVEEKHPAISVKKTDTMGTLIGKFSSTHVHRIFVIDEHNAPIGVVSTIDLLRFLSSK